MAENKETPEHSSLSKPVERPNNPIVEISGNSSQSKNHRHISHHIAHWPPRVLHPTMLRNGCSDIGQFEWGRCAGVEPSRLSAEPIDSIFFACFLTKGHGFHWRAYIQRPVSFPWPAQGLQWRTKNLLLARLKRSDPGWNWGAARCEASSGVSIYSGEGFKATFW